MTFLSIDRSNISSWYDRLLGMAASWTPGSSVVAAASVGR